MPNTIKRVAGFSVCVALVLVLIGCGHHGISGEYLSQNAGEVILLQVTQSGDHDLKGSLISTEYDRSGKLRHDSAAFTGSIDHNQFALNFGMGGPSGIIEGDTITLTTPATLFAPSQKLVLKRASQDAYDRAVKKMHQGAPKRTK